MATLHFPLKRKWFDMILLRIKKAEYRDLNEYWAKRLTENPVITKDYIKPGKPKKIRFRRVYMWLSQKDRHQPPNRIQEPKN